MALGSFIAEVDFAAAPRRVRADEEAVEMPEN
jgi:hypothetical protein